MGTVLMFQEMIMKGTVRAVCTSPAKGTEKRPVSQGIFIKNFGIKDDAHAGKWHRQVSLLSYDKVEEFNARGAQVVDGDFGENLLVEGVDFKNLPVGTIIRSGTVVLRMTQIGKECHQGCAIRNRVGDCIMPREGVFAEVLEEGIIRPGDALYRRCYYPQRQGGKGRAGGQERPRGSKDAGGSRIRGRRDHDHSR